MAVGDYFFKPVVYDINAMFENISDELWEYLGFDAAERPEIMPLTGYHQPSGPFITYSTRPSRKSADGYALKRDEVTYTIYDTDYDRGAALAELMKLALNVTRATGSLDDYKVFLALGDKSTGYRIDYIILLGGDQFPPVERDGYHAISIIIEVGYTPSPINVSEMLSYQ